MTRYALSRTTNDRYPIHFRNDCERTYFDGQGKDIGLFDLIIQLDKAGYDIIHSREELVKILESRGPDWSKK